MSLRVPIQVSETGYIDLISVLAHMDSDDPKMIGKDPEQIPPEAEPSAIESAKNYFLRYPDLPMDN